MCPKMFAFFVIIFLNVSWQAVYQSMLFKDVELDNSTHPCHLHIDRDYHTRNALEYNDRCNTGTHNYLVE